MAAGGGQVGVSGEGIRYKWAVITQSRARKALQHREERH